MGRDRSHGAPRARRGVLNAGLAAVVVAVVAVGCVPTTPPPPPPTLTISANPSLFPAFQAGVSDYVIRCDASTPVMVSVSAPAGTSVSVANQPPGSGTFAVDVTRAVGQDFTMVVQESSGSSTTYYARCLPADFPTWTMQTTGSAQVPYYVTVPVTGSSNYPVIFNNQGVPVWWAPPTSTAFAELLPDGNLAWTSSTGGPAEEHGLDGSLIRTVTNTLSRPNDSHDFLLLPNGDYVIVADTVRSGVDLSGLCTSSGCGPTNTSTSDAVIQEIAPSDGHVVWSWDTADHISPNEMDPQWYQQYITNGSAPYDVYHWNSIEYTGSGFILSFRHLDAVYDIDQSSGSVLWKLGGSTTAESLTVNGDPVFTNGSHFGGQHDARLQPDGTVTLYDDGTNLGRSPRGVRYQVDSSARTATLVEQVTDPLVTVSRCCGSARRVAAGDWIIGWGGGNTASELAPDGSRPFLLQFANGTVFYRLIPVADGVLDIAALRSGMDAQYASSSASRSVPRDHAAPTQPL